MKRVKPKDQGIDEAAEKIVKIIEEDKRAKLKNDVDVVVKGATATAANLTSQNSNLKIKSIVVEGENGTYTVCENGVELRNEGIMMFFENPEQLDNFTKEYKEVFSMI